MQGLKALVIFLGVLIVLGLGVVVYGIATKVGKSDDAPARFSEASVALPAGYEIVEMRPHGERLYLRLEGPDGPRILVLDARGRRVGEIAMEPEPEAGAGR